MSFLDSFVLVLTGLIALSGLLTLVHWVFYAVKDKIERNKK